MGSCRFFGCKPPKMTFLKKKFQILFLHMKCQQKITTRLKFEVRPQKCTVYPYPYNLPPSSSAPSFLLTRGRGKIGVSSNSRRVVIFWCHFMWKNKIRNSFRKKIIFGGLHPQTAKYQFWPENQLFLRTLYLLYSHEMLSLCWPYLIHHNFNVFSVQF